MRNFMALSAFIAACAGTPHRYDNMLGELRRDERAHVDANGKLAAFVNAKQLDRAALVTAAIATNRDVEAMRQAWRAAAAEVRAQTGLDDPMASYSLAPLSIGSDAGYGQVIELRQKLPFPGKRGLAGDAALDDAEVTRADYHAAQLAVAELASQLYDDAYVNARALEINDRHRALVEQMKKVAEARVASSRGSAQDVLQAEVELGHLEHDRVMLETEQITIVARINGLLHRDPSATIPAPPTAELTAPAMPVDVASLLRAAVTDRPQQAAAAARVRASETRVSIAERAYYPDFELMGSYNSMWNMPEHRWMIGVGLNVPIQRGKRAAEVEAAEARVAQARAAADNVSDEIRVEVTRAHRELVEAIHVVHLYDERLLPAARSQVDAALAGFTSGTNDFPAVVSAERGLRDIELAAFRARAEAWRRQATLDRAVGRLPQGVAP